MPQIMQPALEPGLERRFVEGVGHGIDLPPVVVPSFKLGWGSSQAKDGLPKGKRKVSITPMCKVKLAGCPVSFENPSQSPIRGSRSGGTTIN